MRDWNTYAQSKGKVNEGAGTSLEPRVSEYLFIKLSDNWIAVIVVLVMLIFSAVGLCALLSEKKEVVEASKWFFDAAKLCLGVFLGMLTASKTR